MPTSQGAASAKRFEGEATTCAQSTKSARSTG